MILAVGAAIVVRTRLLVVRRNHDDSFLPGYWDLPGGKKRPDERTYAALWRELEEELGFKASRALIASHWPERTPCVPVHVFDYRLKPSGEMLTHITFAIRHHTEFEPELTQHCEHLWADAAQLRGLTPITYEMVGTYKVVIAAMPYLPAHPRHHGL